MQISGFFSYAHADNAYDFLSHLKDDLCTEFNILSGSTLDLYIDRESIAWGDNWRKSIASGINDAGFFIPIISPNYFNSGSCRAELTQYMGKSKELGVKDLLLPLLLADIKSESLGLDTTLVSNVLEYQYLDISDLRFLERGSGQYIKVVNNAARKLWEANGRLISMVDVDSYTHHDNIEHIPADVNGGHEESSNDDGSFLLDSIADFQPTLDDMTASTELINSDIVSIGGCINKANDLIEKKRKLNQLDPKVALALTGQLATELRPISSSYAEHADQFLDAVNKTERVLTPLFTYWKNFNSEEDNLESFQNLIIATKEARAKVQSFKDSIEPAKRLSRSLFKTMQSIESSTSICLAAMDVVIGWQELLDD